MGPVSWASITCCTFQAGQCPCVGLSVTQLVIDLQVSLQSSHKKISDDVEMVNKTTGSNINIWASVSENILADMHPAKTQISLQIWSVIIVFFIHMKKLD